MENQFVIHSFGQLHTLAHAEKLPRALDLVEVHRNGLEPLVGCITKLDLRNHNEFLFQQGVPVKIHFWNSWFPDGPFIKPDGSKPQWLRFGTKPEEVSNVVYNWADPVRASRMKLD